MNFYFLFKSSVSDTHYMYDTICNFEHCTYTCSMHTKQDKFFFKSNKIFWITVQICCKRKFIAKQISILINCKNICYKVYCYKVQILTSI